MNMENISGGFSRIIRRRARLKDPDRFWGSVWVVD